MKATKEARIKKELKKLTEIYAELPQNKLKLVQPLIENAAFIAVTLEELQESINSNGCSDEYQNGANQFGKKASADLQAYNSLFKNYSGVIKQLDQFLPAEKKSNKLEAMLND